jgi:MFS transporter, DHA1 family, tetracycline resistance protein
MKSQVLPVLFVTLLIDMIGFGMVIPVLPVLFNDPASPSFLLKQWSESSQLFMAGFVLALFGLVQFIASPILGELSDVYGRKNVLLTGVVMLAVSQLLFGFAVTIGSLALVIIARALGGIAGANFSVAQAIIADVTTPENRAKSFGIIGAAFGIGFITGPLIGGWFTTAVGTPSAPFVLAGMLGLLNAIGITFALPETHTEKRSVVKKFTFLRGVHNIRNALDDVQARPLFLSNFFVQLGFSSFTTFIGVLLLTRYNYSEADIGMFFAAIGLWIVITQAGILPRIMSVVTEKKVIPVALTVLPVALALHAIFLPVFWMYCLMPLVAISVGLSNACMLSLMSRNVGPDKQGITLGINASVQALALGFGPLAGGLSAAVVGIYAPFLFAALCVAIGGFVFSGNSRKMV